MSDRRFVLSIAVLALSAAMLGAGLVAIFVSLGADGADLPSQGSIQRIINENGAPGLATATPVGPPPSRPVRLAIPRLNIDAPVIAMTLDEQGSPQVPDSGDQVAWYDFSAPPGRGNSVLSGHVDWQTPSRMPIPGVFYRLRELATGDDVVVTLQDGALLKYRVTANVAVPYDDPNIVKAMGPATKDLLTLITCGGTWVKNPREQFGGTYSHRILVRAERVI